ncbi:MAG: hypothetical protein JWN23_749 [Rhodocyclales bacterium]|nr:hypothetical protein [Rhodocyclales bacterium]
MRSRYSAYVLDLRPYLLATWHRDTRPAELTPDAEGTRWLGLEVRKHDPHDDTATVEFVARYKLGSRAYRLHEISRFMREEAHWYYVDGELLEK